MAIQIRLDAPTPYDLTRQLRFEEAKPGETMGVRPDFWPPEWHPQSGVIITWPHAATDWAPVLPEVTRCYVHLAIEIALRERLLIVTPEPETLEHFLREQLPQNALANISLHRIPTNDTWTRDHGPLCLLTERGVRLMDFCFNGWGEKFPAELDNAITRQLWDEGIFNGEYEDHLDFVLEGGSVESDGQGTLLTTTHCLTAPHRNQPLSQADIELRLLHYFRAQRILWLDHGYLAGDDTDSHIDTLARFCAPETIAYVKCTDPTDEHYEELSKMEEQLREFRTLWGEPYSFVPLPMPQPCYDNSGCRLPATYANFLIINGAVLMPTYGQPTIDKAAQAQLQQAFPRHEIVPIDCRTLILQHGSLHCSAMQLPQGALRSKPQDTKENQ
ncbi:MAG: agmatine deiminase family protein [Bacteroidaceae bacterium]|nr:agmatine deiminase family protein [Bacteroidaceae bacterium]